MIGKVAALRGREFIWGLCTGEALTINPSVKFFQIQFLFVGKLADDCPLTSMHTFPEDSFHPEESLQPINY